MEREAAGVLLPTSWFSGHAKLPDDRIDYCLGGSSVPLRVQQVLVFKVQQTGARPWGENWRGLGRVNISSELETYQRRLISVPGGKTCWPFPSEVWTRDLWGQSRAFCRYSTSFYIGSTVSILMNFVLMKQIDIAIFRRRGLFLKAFQNYDSFQE